MPDRLVSANLRISEKIELLADKEAPKFHQSSLDNTINPNRESDIYKVVDSVMQTLNSESRLHTLLEQSLSKTLQNDEITVEKFMETKKSGKEKAYSI